MIQAGYRMEYWARVGDLEPARRCARKIVRSWIGSDGCLYCEVRVNTTCIGYCMELWKLDPSGKVWEMVFVLGKENEFPDRVSPGPNNSFI